ncbi:MAG: MarR family transcriptional regulator [Beijerinckiaceae bacterium]
MSQIKSRKDTVQRPTLELERFLPYRLNVLAALSSEGVARLYSRRFGISIPEWRIVATLGESDRLTAHAIGGHSHMHKTKVSRAVGDLISRGLVRREINKRDLREAFLTLTPSGRAVYEAIAPLALSYEARLVEGLSEADRLAVERAISALTVRSRALLDQIKTEQNGESEPASSPDQIA